MFSYTEIYEGANIDSQKNKYLAMTNETKTIERIQFKQSEERASPVSLLNNFKTFYPPN